MNKTVYIIENINDNVFKIGYTKKNVDARIKELETGNHCELRCILEYETENAPLLESYLHRIFKHKKIKGEWFNLDLNDIVDITKRCKIFEDSIKILKNNNNPYIK